MQHAIRNATCSICHARCNLRLVTCNYPKCKQQDATCKSQHATRVNQNATRNVQRATCDKQQATRESQRILPSPGRAAASSRAPSAGSALPPRSDLRRHGPSSLLLLLFCRCWVCPCAVPARMWACAVPESTCRRGEPSPCRSGDPSPVLIWAGAAPRPDADVERLAQGNHRRLGPVPVQMWAGWAQSRCRCGRVGLSPGADVGGPRELPAGAFGRILLLG